MVAVKLSDLHIKLDPESSSIPQSHSIVLVAWPELEANPLQRWYWLAFLRKFLAKSITDYLLKMPQRCSERHVECITMSPFVNCQVDLVQVSLKLIPESIKETTLCFAIHSAQISTNSGSSKLTTA